MTFQKGKIQNPTGRKPGSKNKTPEAFRKMIAKFIDHNWKGLQSDFDLMKPAERAQFIERLLKYYVSPAINPEALTEDQLKQIIEYYEKTVKK